MYRVVYSNCWEDAEAVIRALNITPGKSYLSIASAGDNTLGILAHNPGFVLAVDQNPAQLACLDLKRAAIEHLSCPETLAFLGVTGSNRRIPTYKNIRNTLAPFARRFWDRNRNDIKHGIIHAGITERNFKRFRKFILPLAMSRTDQAKLIQKIPAKERSQLCSRVLHNLRYHYVMKTAFSRAIVKQLNIGSYSTFAHSGNGNLASIIMERVQKGFNSQYAHDNPYITYIMTGNYHIVLPYYLQETVFHAIKQNIQSLHVFSGTVQQVLKADDSRTFNGFNLSDIFEYMNDHEFKSCLSLIVQRAAPNARFVYWNTLQMRAAWNTSAKLCLCKDLADNLFQKSKSFFYDSLMVYEVST